MPFGVICLDAAGTIVRYNLAEARLARLDRAEVLGRHFFLEVAPCTNVPAFEGRVRAFQGSHEGRLAEAFSFLFDFQFGAQEVDDQGGDDPVDHGPLTDDRLRDLFAYLRISQPITK